MKERTPQEMDFVYQYITQSCIHFYRRRRAAADTVWEARNSATVKGREAENDMKICPCDMFLSMVREPSPVAIHGPEHHYLIPAILLTACHAAQNSGEEQLAADLAEAELRGRNVLKAFCGLYGACGAAVGVGIFASVFTKTTPYSQDTWGMVNMSTAKTLEQMALLGGPRCCKRSSFVALSWGVAFIREHFNIALASPEAIRCEFSDRNLECKRADCPFYPAASQNPDGAEANGGPGIPAAEEASEAKDAAGAKEAKEAKDAANAAEAKEVAEATEAKGAAEAKDAKGAAEAKDAAEARSPGAAGADTETVSVFAPQALPDLPPEQEPCQCRKTSKEKAAALIIWKKDEGEAVEKDEILCEMETDKCAFSIPSPISGIVRDIRIKDGAAAGLGDLLCLIEKA